MNELEMVERVSALPLHQQARALELVQQIKQASLIPKANASPLSFREFISSVNPGFRWNRFAETLVSVYERVVSGELRRVIVMAPPQHGKSEIGSRLLPAYFVYRKPERFAAISSYGSHLAEGMNRHARRHYFATCGVERTETTSVEHWETGKGGGAWAVGVGSGATGRGYSLGVTDDPVKDDKDAQSEVVRTNMTEWFESVWSTRMAPDAAQVVMMTRWHEQDLVGYLLEKESGESPECWHVVNMQAIYDPANMIELPKSCTLEPDWRKPGEALCPERYPIDVLRSIEQKRGPRVWASLYQQYPRPRDGSMFKWEHFADRFLDAIPSDMIWLAYWDTAGTEGGGDHTAGALVGYNARRGRFHIADVVRGQWGPSRKDLEIRATCDRWRSLVGLSNVWLETEAGIGGKDRTRATIAALVGYRVQSEHPTGSKVVRAEVWAAQQEAGNVTMSRDTPERRWNHGFITRSTAFPYSEVDDEQDAVAGAFAKISSSGAGVIYVHPDDREAVEREVARLKREAVA
jgi:predicted phage terminase large subunit-like protein